MPVDLVKHEPPFNPEALQQAVRTVNRLIGASLMGLRARTAFGFVLSGQPVAARALLRQLPPNTVEKIHMAALTLATEASVVLDTPPAEEPADADA